MARRTFIVADIIEILVRWQAGLSQSEIAQNLGIDRKTAGKYISAAVAAGMAAKREPLLTHGQWEARVRDWFPELADAKLRQVTQIAIDPYREYIALQLQRGTAVSLIYRRLREEYGLPVSLASFRRYTSRINLGQMRRCSPGRTH
jgi:predicted transcriptional regulator